MMYNNLVLYRNELKNKSIKKYKVIGITAELILSKKTFRKNADIEKFIWDIFNEKLKQYVLRSRTMIVAKTSRLVEDIDNINDVRKKLYIFVCNEIEKTKKLDENINGRNEFDGWIE